jgi:hypothetical protein
MRHLTFITFRLVEPEVGQLDIGIRMRRMRTTEWLLARHVWGGS